MHAPLRAFVRCGAALALAGLVGAAHAQPKACLLEGGFNVGPQKVEIRDCLQNDGVPHEQFVSTCGEISNMATMLGAPPAKITYLAACPAKPQARCEGFFGTPMTSFYYVRDAQLLATSKKGCVGQGGKWKDG